MSDKGWGSLAFVTKQFRSYYQSASELIEAPTDIRRREFGFLSFEGKSMSRHLSFGDVGQLRLSLIENTPAHVYYSSAYYSAPTAEMDRKSWLGADLVFDIDADHINTPCKADHDRWRCRSCGAEGRGKVPESCQSCGKSTFEEETWLCERCLDTAKFETQKLLDMLIGDFGFSPREIDINFTGNRGYHVHVKDPKAKTLDQLSRREIVDYVTGTGIKPEHHGFAGAHGGPSTLAESGWRGRSARALYDYLSEADEDSLQGLKLSKTAARRILDERDGMLQVLRESHLSRVLRYIDMKSLGALLEASVLEQASAIDTVVTTDVHRLIRLPNTLHGKTGLMAQKVGLEELEDYDPLRNAIAFRGSTIAISIRSAPRFRIGDEEFGPFNDERAELPLAAAMFLLCRKAAEVEG